MRDRVGRVWFVVVCTMAPSRRPDEMVEKLPDVYQDPKSWVVTGTQGMFAYPKGIADSDATIGNTLGGTFKIVLQVLMRMGLGI